MVLTRAAEAAGALALGTGPGWTAILRGALPTGIVATTVRVARLTTETSFEPSFVTYAVFPSDVAVTQCGVLPTRTVPATVPLAASMIPSSPGPWLGTRAQRPSRVNGAWCGDAPTGICALIWFVAVSRTWTEAKPATVK